MPEPPENHIAITIYLPDEDVLALDTLRAGKSIEEFILKIIRREINRRHQDDELQWLYQHEAPPKIIALVPLETFSVIVTFENGEQVEYDMKSKIELGPVFLPLADLKVFQKVAIGGNGRYIFWPGEVEIGADSIYWHV